MKKRAIGTGLIFGLLLIMSSILSGSMVFGVLLAGFIVLLCILGMSSVRFLQKRIGEALGIITGVMLVCCVFVVSAFGFLVVTQTAEIHWVKETEQEVKFLVREFGPYQPVASRAGIIESEGYYSYATEEIGGVVFHTLGEGEVSFQRAEGEPALATYQGKFKNPLLESLVPNRQVKYVFTVSKEKLMKMHE